MTPNPSIEWTMSGTLPSWRDGASSVEEVRSELAEKGVVFAMAEAKGPLRVMLDRTGLTQQIGSVRFFPTLTSAVEAFRTGYAGTP